MMDNWKLQCPSGHEAVLEVVTSDYYEEQFPMKVFEKDEEVNPRIVGGCQDKYCNYRGVDREVKRVVQFGDDSNWPAPEVD